MIRLCLFVLLVLLILPACGNGTSSPDSGQVDGSADGSDRDAADGGIDGGQDAGGDPGLDAGGDLSPDAGPPDAGPQDGAMDAGIDAGIDAGQDAGGDSYPDAGGDSSPDEDGDPGPNPFEEAEQNPGEWVWIPVEGTSCRGGSSTGMGVRLQEGADKLVIYLEGGGACFSILTCALYNPDHFAEEDFHNWVAGEGTQSGYGYGTGQSGIFNTDNLANPVRDWNFVYIPYCTGDIHAGQNPAGMVPNTSSPQAFVGYLNVTRDLELVGPYFADMSQVLLAGISAGACGSLANFDQVAATFPDTQLNLIADSCAMFELDTVMSPCMQQTEVELWQVQLYACPACTQPDGLVNVYAHLADTYPTASFGFLSSTEDRIMRIFLGYGQNDCSGILPVPSATYLEGLTGLRDDVLVPTGRWSTFFLEGNTHTMLPWQEGTEFHPMFDGALLYQTEVSGVALTDWMTGVLSGVIQQVH